MLDVNTSDFEADVFATEFYLTNEKIVEARKKCDALIERARGRIISKVFAKKILKYQIDGAYSIMELRYSETLTLVTIRKNISNNEYSEELSFFVEGKSVNNKLNMT